MMFLQGIVSPVEYHAFQSMDFVIHMRHSYYVQVYRLQVWRGDWDMRV